MELYILSDRKLDSIMDWQAAINANGFTITLDDSRPFADLRGFLPASFDGEASGFECDHWDGAELVADLVSDGFEIDRPWKHVLAFRWGSDFTECVAAYSAGASYARATEGVMFDCEEGRLYEPKDAIELARKLAMDLRNPSLNLA
jgi:hypothetical protein